MITPEDEDSLRLGMFAASLLVIASRERTMRFEREPVERGTTEAYVKMEARAIAQAVIDEARRLEAEKP